MNVKFMRQDNAKYIKLYWKFEMMFYVKIVKKNTMTNVDVLDKQS